MTGGVSRIKLIVVLDNFIVGGGGMLVNTNLYKPLLGDAVSFVQIRVIGMTWDS
jgi:hypothetical protein